MALTLVLLGTSPTVTTTVINMVIIIVITTTADLTTTIEMAITIVVTTTPDLTTTIIIMSPEMTIIATVVFGMVETIIATEVVAVDIIIKCMATSTVLFVLVKVKPNLLVSSFFTFLDR